MDLPVRNLGAVFTGPGKLRFVIFFLTFFIFFVITDIPL